MAFIVFIALLAVLFFLYQSLISLKNGHVFVTFIFLFWLSVSVVIMLAACEASIGYTPRSNLSYRTYYTPSSQSTNSSSRSSSKETEKASEILTVTEPQPTINAYPETEISEQAVELFEESITEILPNEEPLLIEEPFPVKEPMAKTEKETETEKSEEPETVKEKKEYVYKTTYVLNTNTKKFHRSGCSEIKKMKASNKKTYTGSRKEVIAQGYSPCKKCDP